MEQCAFVLCDLRQTILKQEINGRCELPNLWSAPREGHGEVLEELREHPLAPG